MWDFSKYISRDLALKEPSQGSNYSWAYVDFTNDFINFIKRSLIGGGTRGEIEISRKTKVLVRALLLLTLDFFTRFGSASLFYLLVELAGKLMEEFCWVQDFGAILKK